MTLPLWLRSVLSVCCVSPQPSRGRLGLGTVPSRCPGGWRQPAGEIAFDDLEGDDKNSPSRSPRILQTRS